MKKGILLASITSVAVVTGSLAFILGNKGIRFEATKADPVTATVSFDKNHHATDFVLGYNDRERADYEAPSSNGGYSTTWLQHFYRDTEGCVHDKAPENAFYSFTSKGEDNYFFLRIVVVGLSSVSWDISYTGLDESNKGSLVIGERDGSWGFRSSIHSSGLYNNGENSIDCSISAPYHLELYISEIPEGATVTINSFVATYDVASCKENHA